MKICLLLFVCFVCFVGLIASHQYISLDIPQHHVNERNNKSFTTYITKKYYFGHFFKANFFTAYQYCLQSNMELMTIDSKEEETAFLNMINSKDFEYKFLPHLWTSGTDLGEEGKFYFLTNGKSIGNLNWATDEPNNGRRQDSTETENCMAYTTTDNLKFYRLFDRFCSLKFNFVCQEVQKKPLYLNSVPKYR